MASRELEELTWLAVHGRGVVNTAQASQIAMAIAQAGVAAGREAYYYMRYDDSPERVQVPLIYYAVLGRPDVEVILPEEVEPAGEVFNAVAVLDSAMLVHPTSQRALLLDGAKEDAALIVNTSLAPDAILRLVTKYNCARNWSGSITAVRARRYHPNLAFGMVGAIARAMEGEISLGDIIEAAEASEGGSEAADAVRRAYEEAVPIQVEIKAEECGQWRQKSRLSEDYGPAQPKPKPWDRGAYMEFKRRFSEAPTYQLRYASMPRWEALAPGLIEFNPRPGERNVGFRTALARTFRPVIDMKACIDCKLCHIYCPDGAVDHTPIRVDYDYCTGCGICSRVCGPKAIAMVHELRALEGLDEQEVLTIREALIEYAY